MIIGEVGSDGDALVRVDVEDAHGKMREHDRVARTIAVLDTGFNGYHPKGTSSLTVGALALPADEIGALGLTYRYELDLIANSVVETFSV